MIAGNSTSEGGAALPGAQAGHVVVGRTGGLGGVRDVSQVPRGGQAALEGVEHVRVGHDVAGQAVHPQVHLAVQPVVGALPRVECPLVGLGEVVEGDEDAFRVVGGVHVG